MSRSGNDPASEALTAESAMQALQALADPDRAANSAWFFKTGPGEYGEGDRFRGVKVPDQRRLVTRFWRMPLQELERLLMSEWHEDRLLALLCLVRCYAKSPSERDEIHALYMRRIAYVNNWDLVDSSAHFLVGAHLDGGDLSLLDKLAASAVVWERRIAVLATLHFIRNGEFEPTLHIADRLLTDPDDLIHKAVGWMLREAGERNRNVEAAFLATRYRRMPRTMLRYAIEKFPETERQAYLKGTL